MVTDYAQLAKRISAITTNCLLTAVVLVAGLGFGRQALRWWASDTAESADAPRTAEMADGLGDPTRMHVIGFGEGQWSLRRQSLGGDRQAAATALRAVCREVARQDRVRGESPGEAESDFLSRLAAREPAEQEPGKWRLYELDEAFPMVVGTQPRAAGGDSPQGEDLPGPGRRVVVWGLALPVGPQAWTLFTFQPEVPAGRPPAAGPEIPIPAGCRRTLSMRVAGGGGTVGFVGRGDRKTWIDFYDRWFATHNWVRAGPWQQFGPRWHARYTAPRQDAARRWQVDVHFGADAAGRSTGLLITSPSSTGLR